MNAKIFDKVVKRQQDLCTEILVVKAAEYAPIDRLKNFKTTAALRDCTPSQALLGMMAKHTVSIYDMVESGNDFDMAVWEEKITDRINYLLLLKAIVVEEQTGEIK